VTPPAGPRALGVDIGGSGIKGALVDLEHGVLAAERVRLETPQPATPGAVVAAAAEVIRSFEADGPVGIGLPAAIVGGEVMTAANLDKAWIGASAETLFTAAVGRPCAILNDADAAGLAEMRFGAGAGVRGVVLVLTLGTGIGSALFLDGRLVPNTELGHIEVRGKDAELRAAATVRKAKKLSMERWARRLDEYIDRVDQLLWPDLIILGGGISRRADEFLHLLTPRPRVVPAALQNEAGIIGAALRAAELPAIRAEPTRRARRPASGAR
jgi:polyphosphate glucokinase